MHGSKLHRTLLLGLLTAALSGGCVPLYHNVCTPLGIAESCHTLPPCARNKVYVFLINGYDPTNCANFRTLKGYLNELGFCKVYYGQFFYTKWYCDEIRRIHECEPDAHFVIVGYSLGAEAARKVACCAAQDGVSIDLLVYIDGDTLPRNDKAIPGNVQRTVNFISTGPIFHGYELPGADNRHTGRISHYGLPTCEETLAVIGHELMAVAGSVECVMPVQPLMPMIEEGAPTPRPVEPRSMQPRDAWDFLKPVTSLHDRPEATRYRAVSETIVSQPSDNRQTAR